MAVETLNQIFARTLTIPRPAVQRYKKDDRWIDITVQEFGDRVRHFSTGLRVLGVKPEDRVGILSENRPEWTMADFAILAANAVSVPIYPTLLGWQIEYILNDSDSVAVACSDAAQLEKLLEIRHHTPSLRHIIVMDPSVTSTDPMVRSFQSVVDEGARCESEEGRTRFDELLMRRKASDLATIVYTSGTTGDPKGAMLTHGNITTNVVASMEVIPFHEKDLALSILPLSHILERMAEFAYFHQGGTIAYAESLAKVAENMAEVRPEVFCAVPRLFEKMHMRIMENVAIAGGAKQKLFQWAIGVARERLPYIVERKPMPGGLAFKSSVADKIVFGKIKERLGGRIRFIISGGAPLSADLAAFFIGAGIDIFEGYGLTETSPVIAANTPEFRRIGTVGKPIPGVEVKIAEDGEILTRGPHVMIGYYNKPASTAQAIDSEGWFHTGDIGEIDKDGFLKITDRKKELIINAYGKNIAPQPLENLLKASPYIATPVLIGDRRKYLSAIIIPNFEKLERDAKAMGLTFTSREELVRDARIRELLQKEIDRFNSAHSRAEQVRKFELLASEFTIEGGELTPSMKIKRKAVDEKYKPLIDSMYAEEASAAE
ncbi:MAG: AMP-dependent synthetase/ligase [Thermoanaerobaculia bacterium]